LSEWFALFPRELQFRKPLCGGKLFCIILRTFGKDRGHVEFDRPGKRFLVVNSQTAIVCFVEFIAGAMVSEKRTNKESSAVLEPFLRKTKKIRSATTICFHHHFSGSEAIVHVQAGIRV